MSRPKPRWRGSHVAPDFRFGCALGGGRAAGIFTSRCRGLPCLRSPRFDDLCGSQPDSTDQRNRHERGANHERVGGDRGTIRERVPGRPWSSTRTPTSQATRPRSSVRPFAGLPLTLRPYLGLLEGTARTSSSLGLVSSRSDDSITRFTGEAGPQRITRESRMLPLRRSPLHAINLVGGIRGVNTR